MIFMRFAALLVPILIALAPMAARADYNSCVANGGVPAICQCEASGGIWDLSGNSCSGGSFGGGGPGGSSQTFGGGGPGGSSQTFGGGGPGTSVGLENPLGTTDLMTLLMRILAFVIRIGAIVVVFMLVYVGYIFATSPANPDRIQEGKKALLYTIIGALILLGSQAIALGIQATVKALSVGN